MRTLALGQNYSEFRLVGQCYYVKTGLQLKKHHIAWWYCGLYNPWGVYRFEEKEKKIKINYIWFFFFLITSPQAKAIMPLKHKRLLGVKFYFWLKDRGGVLWTRQYVNLPLKKDKKIEVRMWRKKRGKWK